MERHLHFLVTLLRIHSLHSLLPMLVVLVTSTAGIITCPVTTLLRHTVR
jgi:hypothetical protein